LLVQSLRPSCNAPLPTPPAQKTAPRPAYHLYTFLKNSKKPGISRDPFIGASTAENVGVGVHYRSIPVQPYYAERFGWKPEDYPNSVSIGEQTVSLPLSAKLRDEDVHDVIQAVRKTLGA